MRTETIEIFKFDELSDGAKEKARDWWRQASAGDWAWMNESRQSIEAFLDHFGLTLSKWEIDAWSYGFTLTVENSHVRGVKLRDFNRDNTPTGYILDCALWMTFYDEFKRTGDAKHAVGAAVHAGFAEWRDDLESQQSDEYTDDVLTANEYEFTIEGKRA